ncbi:MAG: LysO family transporter [Firmicutes bacterium]|jgi:uncharacterized membrane protein YbjE (DUF340 family)|nr:LysO family transporter [Bacillota bacterium]
MEDLILYLGITAVGYVLGNRLKEKKEQLGWTSKVQTAALIILILLMGMRMGANKEVTSNMSTIGVTALAMTLVIIAMSVIAIVIVRKMVGINRYGQLDRTECPAAEGEERETEMTSTAAKEESSGSNTMTLFIIASVIIGMAVGYFFIRKAFADDMSGFDQLVGMGIKIGLCLLLIFVGLDLGLEGTVVDNFKKVGLRILVFPLATIIGTLGGALICSVFAPISIRECLAIGAGFGWYSLAPGIIMEHGYVTASAISFLHNVMRELLSIVFIPLVAKKVGYVETTAMPGAAAMDVCLPVVEKATSGEIAVYSFLSGAVLSIMVPILVPLFIS